MGTDAMIFVFWMLSFKPTLSLFHFHQEALSFLCTSAIRVVSSAYLRLLIFLLAILVPACASSSPAFCMMYSAYKLNKRGDNILPLLTPFPILNQFIFPCPVLTVVCWFAASPSTRNPNSSHLIIFKIVSVSGLYPFRSFSTSTTQISCANLHYSC